MSSFDHAFEVVIGMEGGFTSNPADPGNWTGGRIGSGTLRGTKFGISAAAYPQLDVGTLTLGDAQDIYKADYWNRVLGDQMPAPLALLLFDAAVNCGVNQAVKWIQQAAHAVVDGQMGPGTLEAISHAAQGPSGGLELCSEFLALRFVFMTGLPTWRSFGLGWARRLCRLPYESLASSN